MDDKTASQAALFANRLRKRLRHLTKWARRTGVEAFRLYDRDIPEVPLALEVYGPPENRAAALSLYQRPYEKDEADEERWLAAMRSAAAGILDLDEQRVFLKRRRKQRPNQGEQYGPAPGEERGEAPSGGETLEVADGYLPESGSAERRALRFQVNLAAYVDTGLFTDSRKMRHRLYTEAAGKSVLNLFCYTGAFSVYAAAGGAEHVDSVDLSNPYLAWAARNLRLNGLTPGVRFASHRSDALRFLDEAAAKARRYDIIILDPPTFSNSKRMTGIFDIRRDHAPLITTCLALLTPGGKLYFSAKARTFKLDPSLPPPADLTAALLDEDHPRHPPLWLLWPAGERRAASSSPRRGDNPPRS